jgi:MFS family permease
VSADTPSGTSVASRTAGRRRTVVLAVVSAAIFFDALDLSITQIALPAIQTDLLVATSTLPWIATAYVVTYGGFLMLGGRASDLLGSSRVFLAGLAVFGVASLACGLAGSAAELIAARGVQGVGAALAVPAAIAILAGTFTHVQERAHAFGVFAAAAASGFTAGLVLGGLITSGLSWRWIFLAKVPAVVVALTAAVIALPSAPRQIRRGRYDVAGAAAVTAGSVLLMYGITRAGTPGTTATNVIVPVAVGVGLLVVFVGIERSTRSPLLPLRLLRLRTLATSDAAALTVLAAPFGISYVATVYLQGVLHRPAWQVAMVLLPGSIAAALVSRYLAPALLHRFGLRTVYGAALLIVGAGDSALIGLEAGRATWIVIAGTLVSFGLGMGLAYPAATLGGVQGVEPADRGAAAGLNNTALQLGGGLGLAVVATAVTAALHGSSPDVVTAEVGLQAARWGAVAATILPMLGALTVLVGMSGRPRHGAE